MGTNSKKAKYLSNWFEKITSLLSKNGINIIIAPKQIKEEVVSSLVKYDRKSLITIFGLKYRKKPLFLLNRIIIFALLMENIL